MEKANLANKLEDEVIFLIRNSRNLLRDAVEKKGSVIVLNHIEQDQISRMERDKNEEKKVREIVSSIIQEDDNGQVLEFRRIGKYVKGKPRPLKVTFSTSQMAEEIVRKGYKLRFTGDNREVKIRGDHSFEDRQLLKKKK